MTDRVDKYLEGGLDRSQLTADERADVRAIEHVIHETRAFVDSRPGPDVSARVMRQIERLKVDPATRPATAFRRFVAALWTARHVSFEFRPAYGLLTAVAVVALMSLWPSGQPSDIPSTESRNVDTRLFVQFRLQAADASNVRLAGSFTNWQPRYELRQTTPGIWAITLPLSQGVHDYAFVVDGQQWVPDPYAPRVDDGFGGTNSRLTLLVPETPGI
jgi:AMP-activated protein kinase-like protein